MEADIQRLFPDGAVTYRLVIATRASLATAIAVLAVLDVAGAELVALDVRESVQTVRLRGLTAEAVQALVARIERLDGVESAAVEHWIMRAGRR